MPLPDHRQPAQSDQPPKAFDTSSNYFELVTQFNDQNRPIEVDFRKLVDWLRMGDQLTHHIHPYPAKLLPHIAHYFLNARALHKSGSPVLDPFCGSGTVALEASIAGYEPLIADANPLSILLSAVKTYPFNADSLEKSLSKTLTRARRLKTAPTVNIVNESLWYGAKQKKSLEIILRAINEESDEKIRAFLLIGFSATARRISYADPAISVPVRLRTKDRLSERANKTISERLLWLETVSAIDEYKRCVTANIDRVRQTNLLFPNRRAAKVVGSDARNLTTGSGSLASNSIPLIITSPPYGSAQKYIRASSLSLNWLGLAAPSQLSELEGKSIGREHVPAFRESSRQFEKLPRDYENQLDEIKKIDSTRAEITRHYLSEMRTVVAEMTRVMAPKGRAVIVIGNNQVSGKPLRNDDFIIEAFQNHGVKLELNLVDHIKSRGLMTKRNRTASVISRESVMVFRKD